MALIQGTTAGEVYTSNSKGPKGSFFKDGIQTQIISAPKEGHSLDVIILPSFDMSKGPSEFKTSYVAYREQNSDLIDPITKTPAFTHWAKSCKAYTYFGNARQNFVSPLTGKAYRAVKSKRDNKVRYYPPYNTDPIVDIANYVFFNKDKVDAATARLFNKSEDGQTKALARAPKSYVLSNALVRIDNGDWQFKVIAYSEMAYVDLVNLLAQMTGKSQNGLTPAFDDYLFGDITDPLTGSILTVSLKSGNGIPFAGFNISADNRTLNGRRAIPQGLITPEILSKRAILNDTDYLDVWSYQQIVDFLVEDGVIPINVIRDGVKPGTIVEPKQKFNQQSATQYNSIPVEKSTAVNTPVSPLAQNINFGSSPITTSEVSSFNTIVQESHTTESSNNVSTNLTQDPEFPVFKDLFLKVSGGSASPDEVMALLRMQEKFGPASNYNF